MSEDNFGFPRYFQWSEPSRKASGAQRVSGGEGRNGRIREMSVGNSGAAVPAAGAGVSPANSHAGGTPAPLPQTQGVRAAPGPLVGTLCLR